MFHWSNLAETETTGSFTGGLHESRNTSTMKAFEKSSLSCYQLIENTPRRKQKEKKIKDLLAIFYFKKMHAFLNSHDSRVVSNSFWDFS